MHSIRIRRSARPFQEESGYGGEGEYASYHPEGKNGQEEGHVEPAVLVQPLQESSVEAEAKANAIGRLCQDTRSESCMDYVHWYSGIVKAAKGVWHVVKTAAVQTYHSLGAGDPYDGRDGRHALETFYQGSDAKECFDTDECANLGGDLGRF
jgi:hypothetical protein